MHTPKLRSCMDCGGLISKSALRCPHCGKRLRSHGLIQAITFLIVAPLALLLLIFIVGSVASVVRHRAPIKSVAQVPEDGAVVATNVTMIRVVNGVEITGSIQNLKPVRMTNLTLRVGFYDSRSNKLGVSSDSIALLESRDSWPFRVVFNDRTAHSAKLEFVGSE